MMRCHTLVEHVIGEGNGHGRAALATGLTDNGSEIYLLSMSLSRASGSMAPAGAFGSAPKDLGMAARALSVAARSWSPGTGGSAMGRGVCPWLRSTSALSESCHMMHMRCDMLGVSIMVGWSTLDLLHGIAWIVTVRGQCCFDLHAKQTVLSQ